MPIFIEDYEWQQNECLLTLEIGLRKIEKNVDITLTSCYIKVNFSPYIFEGFLSEKIEPEYSTNTIKDGKLVFNLKKVDKHHWDTFAFKPKTKEEAQNLRKLAIEEFEEIQNKKFQNKLENKRELNRFAVSKQIEQNEEMYRLKQQFIIDQTKEFFNEDDLVDKCQTAVHMRLSSTCSEEGFISEADYDGDEESVYHSSLENIPSLTNQITLEPQKIQQREVEKLPDIRESTVVKIHHSPHKLGLPRRSSRTCSESEIYNKSEDDSSPDVIIKEKEKYIENIKLEAKKYFEKTEYKKSSELYSEAIIMNSTDVSNYSNRAACYLAIDSNEKAVKDCSKALSLLNKTCGEEETKKSRLLCLVRRGTAYVRLHQLENGLYDYTEALQLDPKNSSIAKDVRSISAFLNASSDTGGEESGDFDLADEMS